MVFAVNSISLDKTTFFNCFTREILTPGVNLDLSCYRSILTVPWVEIGGKTNITCSKTGYQAAVQFHCRVCLLLCSEEACFHLYLSVLFMIIIVFFYISAFLWW